MTAADLSEVRKLFPGTERQTYMDVSVRGLLSTHVRQAVTEYLDLRMYHGGDKAQLRGMAEDTRSLCASMLGAEDDEISVVKNVSEGLNAFACSLPWKAGDNVVLCPDLEHPNNVFLWYNLRRQRGVEVREVEPLDGARVPVERLVEAMDRRTRLVTVPSITFSPGLLTDVAALATEARQRNVLTLIDAAQSVGAVETNVRELGVDALAVATQKSLLAFYGLGFLYCRRELADTLEPVYLARYGVEMEPDAHETALAAGDFEYARGARRFDLGNYNYLGAAAARAAMAMLLEIGIDTIEQHVRSLAKRLAVGLHQLGLPVTGGPPGPDLAHIVALGESGGGRHYTADDPAMNSLYQFLTDQDVTLSIRRGVLRFSLAVYNNEEDVDRVLGLVTEWMG